MWQGLQAAWPEMGSTASEGGELSVRMCWSSSSSFLVSLYALCVGKLK